MNIQPLDDWYGDLHPLEYEQLSDYDQLVHDVELLFAKLNEVIEALKESAPLQTSKDRGVAK